MVGSHSRREIEKHKKISGKGKPSAISGGFQTDMIVSHCMIQKEKKLIDMERKGA